jgi:hypothetical protein
LLVSGNIFPWREANLQSAIAIRKTPDDIIRFAKVPGVTSEVS